MNTSTKNRFPIKDDAGIHWLVLEAKKLAGELGFEPQIVQMLATAASELGHNIIKYAGRGHITLSPVRKAGKNGLEITCRDSGPGIADIEQALQDNYSSSGTLGLGLPGLKRMMDEFEIESTLGQGTTVTVRKWL